MCESHGERLDFLLSSVSTVICSDHYTLDLSWLMHCDYWDDCGLVLFYFSLFNLILWLSLILCSDLPRLPLPCQPASSAAFNSVFEQVNVSADEVE